MSTSLAGPPTHLAFIGTYTRGTSKGIYVADYASGRLNNIRLATESVEPSFLAIHPSGDYLFAANELGEFGGEKSGAVSAFQIDRKTGALSLINQQPSRGQHPCHLVTDSAGKNVLVANYSGGSLAVLPIGLNGSLAPATSFVQHSGSSVLKRQSSPHAHSINLDRANRFAFVADLGLDQILVYRYDLATGKLSPHEPAFLKVAGGAGPRHLAFSPLQRNAYVINEINNTIEVFAYDADAGRLQSIQIITTLPSGFDKRSSTAEVVVSQDGRFVFGSNRGHDSIAAFSRDKATGKLTLIEIEPTNGSTPRNFVISPDGRYLLVENQSTNSIVTMEIDSTSGHLTPVAKVDVPSPVCIRFLELQSE
jgi:6-phosphogluconolactonase